MTCGFYVSVSEKYPVIITDGGVLSPMPYSGDRSN